MRSALLTALTFSLAGPAIGTLIYAGWGFLESGNSAAVGSQVLAGLWMLPFGYMLGLLPGAATGFFVGLSGRGLAAAPFVMLAAMMGAAVMGLVGVFGGPSPELTQSVVNMAILGGLAGGLAGALSRALVSRKRASIGSVTSGRAREN